MDCSQTVSLHELLRPRWRLPRQRGKESPRLNLLNLRAVSREDKAFIDEAIFGALLVNKAIIGANKFLAFYNQPASFYRVEGCDPYAGYWRWDVILFSDRENIYEWASPSRRQRRPNVLRTQSRRGY
jgi:hypothetical protein